MQRESEREAAKGEIQTLKEAILMRKAENERELRRRERLEKEAKDIKTVRAAHSSSSTPPASAAAPTSAHLHVLL